MGRIKTIDAKKRAVVELLMIEKKSLTKGQIGVRLQIPPSTVDRICRDLRKDNVLGMHRRKWWGLRVGGV